MVNNKMNPQELITNVSEFLKERNEGSLATCMNNVPRSSPVQYFMGDNLDIYIVSAGGDKFEAIKKNPNVCFLASTQFVSPRQIKGVQVFGTATTSIDNPNIYEEAIRYCNDDNLLNKSATNLKIIKVTPSEVIYLDSLEDGNRTKQVLKQNTVFVKEDEMVG